MEFLEVIKRRRSTRIFLKKTIEEEKLKEILENTNLAPSAHNWQSYKIYVIKNQIIKDKLTESTRGQSYISEAPIVLVFTSLPNSQYGDHPRRDFYSLQDATIACYQAWLAAVNWGLSAVWIGAFEDQKVKEILNLSKNESPVAILPIGYSAKSLEPTPRKSLTEIIVEI